MNAPLTEDETPSTVHDLLASAYRRQVLRYLVTGDVDVASVADLVDELIDHDETADDRRRIAIKLHHVALPKLAAAGFIEYDARTQTASACEYPPTELSALTASLEGA